ncbi:MAG: sigma factor-like helix-turn-helix DNA-binding protein [Gemmatimonadales bacterium]
MERALAALKPEDRLVLDLYVVEDLPAAQVAKILGLPNAKAVYNRAQRTLAALRECLRQAGASREDL